MATYASLFERAIAIIIDTIIVGVVMGVLLYGAVGASGSSSISFVITLLALLYYILLEGPMGGGQTLGKRIMSIKVTTEGGGVPSYVQALIRTILRIIDAMPSFYILGAILVWATGKNQRLGDMLAKTVVVKA